VFGSTVAAPVAKEIIDALLVLEKIPPSKPPGPQPQLNRAG
jgi:cell division protein FtsI (penicillin-binding protein 3)